MHTNVEYLSCGEVEAWGYFQLSNMRYNDRNAVNEKVQQSWSFTLFKHLHKF